MRKIEHRYTVRFLTPAFLGDAEQNGRWRTPPFKAQLRQWWRVAYAADKNFGVDVEEMRREEGLLFGNAWLSHREGNREVADHRKSLVQIRLSHWELGKQASWEGLEQGTVNHPEVQKTNYKVGPQAYLGFGPLDARGGTKLAKANAAIQADEFATLSLACPEQHAALIERALWLMDQYGTVGGRSRNGWGSYRLSPKGNTPPPTAAPPLRSWRECLQLDWPHAVGQDAKGPLIWQTSPHDDWKSLMKTLAVVKIGLRTQFRFPNERPDGQIHERHWLSYPVTKHQVSDWNRSGLRLPNTLRFKARLTSDGKLVGVIFHVPHLPPAAFRPDRRVIVGVWAKVHAKLDATPGLARSKE